MGRTLACAGQPSPGTSYFMLPSLSPVKWGSQPLLGSRGLLLVVKAGSAAAGPASSAVESTPGTGPPGGTGPGLGAGSSCAVEGAGEPQGGGGHTLCDGTMGWHCGTADKTAACDVSVPYRW